MSYTTSDFSESLERTIPADQVAKVIAAWGSGDGMGTDAGHYRWGADGASDWSGGFLLRLKDGRYAYITGWCDYTGWGCQDGAEVSYYDKRPKLSSLGAKPADSEWDIEPIDLNRWLKAGAKGIDA